MTYRQSCRDQPALAAIHRAFDKAFAQDMNTVLLGGAKEPLYQPAEGLLDQHTIFYTLNYPASALHEVAHWCIAGKRRRGLVDYGYWYAPDGRSADQQHAFEQVEVKPQAIEWHFSLACQMTFHLSADNLEAAMPVSDKFANAVIEQARAYAVDGLPVRAARFRSALVEQWGGVAPNIDDFCLAFL